MHEVPVIRSEISCLVHPVVDGMQGDGMGLHTRADPTQIHKLSNSKSNFTRGSLNCKDEMNSSGLPRPALSADLFKRKSRPVALSNASSHEDTLEW